MSSTGDPKYGTARSRSNCVAGSASTDLPIPLRGSHAAVLHDTGTGFTILPGQRIEDPCNWVIPVVETCQFIASRRNGYVHLKRSLLVRIKTDRKGELVEILSGSQEIGRGGLALCMPCTLDLHVGAACDMELFLTQDREPLPVRGTVRKISRMIGEDTIRYRIEIEFDKLGRALESELRAFVDAARPEELHPLLV